MGLLLCSRMGVLACAHMKVLSFSSVGVLSCPEDSYERWEECVENEGVEMPVSIVFACFDHLSSHRMREWRCQSALQVHVYLVSCGRWCVWHCVSCVRPGLLCWGYVGCCLPSQAPSPLLEQGVRWQRA